MARARRVPRPFHQTIALGSLSCALRFIMCGIAGLVKGAQPEQRELNGGSRKLFLLHAGADLSNRGKVMGKAGVS